MNRYTLVWWEAAEDDLLRLWLNSTDRQQITDATLELDRLLSSQADTVGQESHEGLHALEVGPLRVQYSIFR